MNVRRIVKHNSIKSKILMLCVPIIIVLCTLFFIHHDTKNLVTKQNDGSCLRSKSITPLKKSVFKDFFSEDKELQKLYEDKNLKWENKLTCNTLTMVNNVDKSQNLNDTSISIQDVQKYFPNGVIFPHERLWSYNWSGYLANANKNIPVTFAETDYTEPTITTNAKSATSLWVGIGGSRESSKNSSLIQIGSSITTNDKGKESHHLFLEVFPLDPVEESLNFPINAGDKVHVAVEWRNNEAHLTACNITQKICTLVNRGIVPNPGNSAEWILEKTKLGNVSKDMVKFSPVTFSSSYWTTETLKNNGKNNQTTMLFSLNDKRIIPDTLIHSISRSILVAPTEINNNTFSLLWVQNH